MLCICLWILAVFDILLPPSLYLFVSQPGRVCGSEPRWLPHVAGASLGLQCRRDGLSRVGYPGRRRGGGVWLRRLCTRQQDPRYVFNFE